MTYSEADAAKLQNHRLETIQKLNDLQLKCITESIGLGPSRAWEYLRHGVARRLGVLRNAINTVYDVFPPDTKQRLDQESLAHLQLALHGFVINLSGVFDNWAWAFLHMHGLDTQVRRLGVGMFNRETNRHMDQPIRDYLDSAGFIAWRTDYLKNYRDALAHRIPLYIPPSLMTKPQTEEFNRLDTAKSEALRAGQLEQFEDLQRQQDELGEPCFFFLHSLEEGGQRQIMFHPQMLSDVAGVIEFGNIFFQHWRVVVHPQP